jgi:glutaredoxin-like YruB-family protein
VPPQLAIDQVPTVLRLHSGTVLQRIVGALPTAFYERALTDCPVVPKPAGTAPAARRAPQVTVYTTSTCPWCTHVKSHLRKAAVDFREVNVERDEAAARRMMAKSGQMGVPQVEIDGTMVVGFDQKRIDALLGLAGRAGQD